MQVSLSAGGEGRELEGGKESQREKGEPVEASHGWWLVRERGETMVGAFSLFIESEFR